MHKHTSMPCGKRKYHVTLTAVVLFGKVKGRLNYIITFIVRIIDSS